MKTLQKLIMVSRPISWVNTAYPFCIGYLLSGGAIGALWLIGTVYFLFPYNLLMYGINDVFDYESDIRNPRKGGIQGMKEQRAFHPTIITAVLVTNIPFVLYFLIVSPWSARIFLGILLVLVVGYSIKYLRFKEIPFLDSLTSSTHFVGPLVYALLLTSLSTQSWWYVGAFFLWGMASHMVGAVQDIIPDRAAHIHSIATKLGARYTIWLASALYVTALVLVVVPGGWPVWLGLIGLVYVANLIPYLRLTDEKSAIVNTAWRRFIWLNLLVGFALSMGIILHTIYPIS